MVKPMSGYELATAVGSFLGNNHDLDPGMRDGKQSFADSFPQRRKLLYVIEKTCLHGFKDVRRFWLQTGYLRDRVFDRVPPKYHCKPLRKQGWGIAQMIRMSHRDLLINVPQERQPLVLFLRRVATCEPLDLA